MLEISTYSFMLKLTAIIIAYFILFKLTIYTHIVYKSLNYSSKPQHKPHVVAQVYTDMQVT